LIVIDSSAVVDLVARRAPSEWVAEQILLEPSLHAPHVLDIEVVAALRNLVLRGELAAPTAGAALESLAQLDVSRYPHLPLVGRMWQLRATVTAADAAFVVLAESLEAVLLTTDARLARAPGIRATVLTP
jgi:predicted nucleic acid-binding protein